MSCSRPPPLAGRLLRAALSGEEYEAMAGDLEEMFRLDVLPRWGQRRARRWFWRQTLSILWARLFSRRARPHLVPPRKGRPMQGLRYDIRSASRALVRTPGFTLIAVVTLALGVGANTAIFSLLDKLLFESLPVERPRELVMLNPNGSRDGWVAGPMTWSYPAYTGIRDRQRVFTGLLAERTDAVNFAIGRVTEQVTASVVSGNYFDVLGVRTLVGRALSSDDDRVFGGHPVAVLTHGFWVERLGGRPDVVGRTIRLNGHPFTVVGVSEKGFDGLEVGGSVDVIVPVAMLRQVATYGDALTSRRSHIFQIYGRLKPGLSRDEAAAQLQPVYLAELEQDVAATQARGPRDEGWKQRRLLLEDGHRGSSGLRDDLAPPLTALMAMTGVVLLIACANIAGLLMARAAARAKEISIRLAIGASRGRIVRQWLAESTLLAALGGLAGVLVAWWTINLLVTEVSEAANRLTLVTSFLDGRVLAFAIASSLTTGVLFGLLPALHASRNSVASSLKTSAGVDSGGQLRLRRALVAAQVALGVILVTAAGLFLRTLDNLRRTDTGFRTERLVHFSLNPGLAGHDPKRAAGFFHRVLGELRAIPGVSGATLAVAPVLSDSTVGFGGLEVEGVTPRDGQDMHADGNAVAPAYFSMLGMKVIRGRDIDETDTATSQRVAVVNETFARMYFKDRDPLGHKIRLSWGSEILYDHEIVGVASDARIANLRDRPRPNFFMPYTQWNVLTSAFVYVRTSSDADALAATVRRVVQRHDPAVPVVGYRTVDQQIDQLLRPERLVATLSLAFGLLAAGLAAMGLYGVTAFAVARRTREIGIRVALGARRVAVLRMVLRDVAVMAAVGIGVGVVLSLGLGRYVESQLYGVPARDTLTIAAAASALAAVALVSGWLPARRASRVDPMRALREE
ncbi:MAG: ADOP family duplicated permease [Vicinamibacteraceae bacterium]